MPDRGQAHERLLGQIREICGWLGLYSYTTHDSRRSPAGWPDLTIVGEWVMFREVKTGAGKPTKAQQAVMHRLRTARADVDVWQDTDWTAGRIQSELFALARKDPHGTPR